MEKEKKSSSSDKKKLIKKMGKNIKSLKWKIFFGITLISIVGMTLFSLCRVLPEEFKSFESKSGKFIVTVSIRYPSFISIKDYRDIELKLTNMSGVEIPGVKVFLMFREDTPIILTSNSGSSVADFGTLKYEEIKTKKIQFYLNNFYSKKEIDFDLKIKSNENEFIFDLKKSKPSFKISFVSTYIPLKDFSTWFFSTFIASFMVIITSLYSEKLKNMLMAKPKAQQKKERGVI